MAWQPGDSLTCPAVIGRAAELGAIDRFLAGSARSVLLLSGEAGIGKSCLTAAAKARAAAGGYRVLQGTCFEPDRILPYAPLLDLLRTLFASDTADDAVQRIGPAAPEIVKISPELATIFPDVTPAQAVEPEQDKRRLFQAMFTFLTQLSLAAPLLIVIEDLHWSDDTSLDLLQYLARRIGRQSLRLLLTYRTDETHPGLAHLLAELDRERLATEVVLRRLSRADMDAMIRLILPSGTRSPSRRSTTNSWRGSAGPCIAASPRRSSGSRPIRSSLRLRIWRTIIIRPACGRRRWSTRGAPRNAPGRSTPRGPQSSTLREPSRRPGTWPLRRLPRSIVDVAGPVKSSAISRERGPTSSWLSARPKPPEMVVPSGKA